MPRLPPVTSATLPRTLNSSSTFIVALLGFRKSGQSSSMFGGKTRGPARPQAATRRFHQSADARPVTEAKCRVVLPDAAEPRGFLFLFDVAANFLEALLHSLLNDSQSIGARFLNELCDV